MIVNKTEDMGIFFGILLFQICYEACSVFAYYIQSVPLIYIVQFLQNVVFHLSVIELTTLSILSDF